MLVLYKVVSSVPGAEPYRTKAGAEPYSLRKDYCQLPSTERLTGSIQYVERADEQQK